MVKKLLHVVFNKITLQIYGRYIAIGMPILKIKNLKVIYRVKRCLIVILPCLLKIIQKVIFNQILVNIIMKTIFCRGAMWSETGCQYNGMAAFASVMNDIIESLDYRLVSNVNIFVLL